MMGGEAGPALTSRMIGARVNRVEDPRLLRGKARFVGDLSLPGLTHAAFLRSPHPHARIRRIEKTSASALPGVSLVLTGREIQDRVLPIRDDIRSPGYHATDQWPLAVDTVRYVGEPVAVVVAESRYIAEDALDLIEVEYQELPATVDPEKAARPEAPLVHADLESNVLFRELESHGDVEKAFAEALHVVRVRLRHNRCMAASMETRGVVAHYDSGEGSLRVWSSTQIPHILRTWLAEYLRFPEHKLQVISPDVGGGFGLKANIFGEEVIVPLLATVLDRPVTWVADRMEDVLAGRHARDQIVEAELAVAADGAFTGLRARVVVDVGAYGTFPFGSLIEALGTVKFLSGLYKIPTFASETTAVATNKCPVGPYRGVAQPVANVVIESLADLAAHESGIDPAEIRFRNMIKPGEFPYVSPTGIRHDGGSYVESLEKLLRECDYDAFRHRQAEARRQGRLLGLGMAVYVEVTGSNSTAYHVRGMLALPGYEQANIQIQPTGKVLVAVSVAAIGQGVATSIAQVVADELGVPFEDVNVLHGDTALCPSGTGTFASRTMVILGSASALAARELRTKVLQIASHLLEAASCDLEMANGQITVRGAPGRGIALKAVARVAHLQPKLLPSGMAPKLEASVVFDPAFPTVTNNAHVAVVEVDPGTGLIKILRYLVVHDCGVEVNPAIVEGQVHGGIAQGLGEAIYEEMIYDENGQPLVGSLMDYLVPTCPEMPDVELSRLETPSDISVGGFKGIGEGGTIGTPAAIANAVADALEQRARPQELPLTPERVLRLIEQARRAGLRQ